MVGKKDEVESWHRPLKPHVTPLMEILLLRATKFTMQVVRSERDEFSDQSGTSQTWQRACVIRGMELETILVRSVRLV